MSRKLRETTVETINALKQSIETTVKACVSLEEAAQTFTNLLWEEFEESIILVRCFVTLPFSTLPERYQRSVAQLAEGEGVTPLLGDKTPVLTLLGSRGGEEIRNVKQYFGLPLVSYGFIESIPMIADLLRELGFSLNGEKEPRDNFQDTGDIETNSMSFLSGVFYVPDAQHAINGKGERILSAFDRIAVYNSERFSEIQTIFGIGGAYISGPFIAILICTKEALNKKTVEQFVPVTNYVKTSTTKLILDANIFAW
jgi:hypothetical protein